jgi:uncharacterized membrane protein YqgA involved in biofilm formation
MIATVVNALAVIVGSLAGLLVGTRITETYRRVVFTAVGVVAVLIGISMSLESQRFLYLVLALVIGGLIGTALRIEDRIHSFGEWLKRRFAPGARVASGARPASGARLSSGVQAASGEPAADRRENALEPDAGSFAQGFLVSSVLFCVGALAILGSFQAGVEGRYELLFTKSVMDGFMAILLTAAYGVGVAFSALSLLIYQGALTLAAGLIAPYVGSLMISEISGVGGAMVVMIGLNLLELRTIRTADFLPSLVVVVGLVLLDPVIPL